MALGVGQTLSFYEIVAPLGAGSMGEVWRARDTRLEREVAIKVLPKELADDEERLRRFEREAKTLASLNHPNIAGIHSVDQQGSVSFLALELVPGEDLATRLAGGALPVDEAIDVCRQIAEGLEAAHEAGVVHRDLKPANVRITSEGVVKILDFGLAKPIRPRTTRESTSTAESDSFVMTEEGLVLGTPTYMSPEQARGRPVDRRTDIWAFGCVLYECLTGRRPFGGTSLTDVLAAIVEREPDWSGLPDHTPRRVRAMLERCLAKDPRVRLRDIGEARVALESPLAEGTGTPVPARVGLWVAPALTLGLALGAGVVWLARPAPEKAPPRRYDLRVPGYVRNHQFAVSPDGTRLAYASPAGIWIRELGTLDARLLTGTEGALRLTWSPDGKHVAFSVRERILTVPAGGGAPRLVAVAHEPINMAGGIAWQENGRLAFATGNSDLFDVSADGGAPRLVATRDPRTDDDFHGPCALPGGRGVLYAVHVKGGLPSRLALFDGERSRIVFDAAPQAMFSIALDPAGYVLYEGFENAPGIWSLPFSLDELAVKGEPRLVEPDLGRPSVAGNGLLVALPLESRSDWGELRWVDLDAGLLGPPIARQTTPFAPALSPEGNRVALGSTEGGRSVVWIHDLTLGTRFQLPTMGRSASRPLWTPDGTRIAYVTGDSHAASYWIQPADGSGGGRPMGLPRVSDFTPDGETVVFVDESEETLDDIFRSPLGDPTKRTPVRSTPARELQPKLSPDGRFLLFIGDATGREELYVTSFPDGERIWPTPTEGALFARWTREGERILYTDNSLDLYEIEFRSEPEVEFSRPRKRIDFEEAVRVGRQVALHLGFDVDAGGERILTTVSQSDQAGGGALVVLERWR